MVEVGMAAGSAEADIMAEATTVVVMGAMVVGTADMAVMDMDWADLGLATGLDMDWATAHTAVTVTLATADMDMVTGQITVSAMDMGTVTVPGLVGTAVVIQDLVDTDTASPFMLNRSISNRFTHSPPIPIRSIPEAHQ